MTATAEILVQGAWTIMQIVKNGHGLAAEQLETLALRDYRKVAVFLDRLASSGPLGYGQDKNRKLVDQIFELKPTSEVRLPYFFDGPHRIVVTHAFTKKQPKTPRREIERAQALRAEYLEGRTWQG
jgi:phage-related protein